MNAGLSEREPNNMEDKMTKSELTALVYQIETENVTVPDWGSITLTLIYGDAKLKRTILTREESKQVTNGSVTATIN
jgi:hypothetical protein